MLVRDRSLVLSPTNANVSPWNKSEKSEGLSNTQNQSSPERHARSFVGKTARELDLDTVQDDKQSVKDEDETQNKIGITTERMFMRGTRRSFDDGARSDSNSLDG